MDRSKRIRINDFLARKETPVITLSFPPSSGHRAAWRHGGVPTATIQPIVPTAGSPACNHNGNGTTEPAM